MSASILLGAAVLETASWVVLGRQAYQSVMPAGDFDAVGVQDRIVANLPSDLEKVELPNKFASDDPRTSIAVVGESMPGGFPSTAGCRSARWWPAN